MNYTKSIFKLALVFTILAGTFYSCKEDDEGTSVDEFEQKKEEATQAFTDYFDSAENQVTDPQFASNSLTPQGNLGTNLSTPSGGFLQSVNYKGAINPSGTPWYMGWSFFANIVAGTLTSPTTTVPTPTKTITDNGNGTGTVTWSKDTVYILDGFVFVNDGQTLTIEEGTIVKGKPGQEDDASALIVARGGKIMAEGTSTEPIIFTYEADPLDGTSSASTRGQWGGLIILGKAPLNSSPGETAVEGIPTNEPRGTYGGSNAGDNSGVLKYVSIRHGGTDIGEGNEINGLTLGGVGSGTTIEYVEVIANKDDGIEWFGGTVKAKYLIAAYCADDALDYDEGFDGENQFVIVYQDPTSGNADRGGEHDGGTDPETAMPYATPIFYNVTSVGNPESQALTFRDNAGGEYHNSIFVGYANGIDIELLNSSQNTYTQFEDGNLKAENNVFFDIGAGDTGADIFKISAE